MKTLTKALSMIMTVGILFTVSACADYPGRGLPTIEANSAAIVAELQALRAEVSALKVVSQTSDITVLALEPIQLTKNMTEKQKIVEGNKIVEIGAGSGFFCPAYLAERGVRKWKTVGANPYTGTFEHALKKFNWVPAEVTAAWKKIHDEKKGISGVLIPGDVICEMMFSVNGDHKRWGPVTLDEKARYAPSQKSEGDLIAELETIEYRVNRKGKTWVLAIPPRKNDSEGMPLPNSGCNNPSVMILGPKG
jgi:hypothetical protein